MNNSSLVTSAFEDCHSHTQIVCCWLHRDKSNVACTDGGTKVIVHSGVLITVTIHDLHAKVILRTLVKKLLWLPKTNHLHVGVSNHDRNLLLFLQSINEGTTGKARPKKLPLAVKIYREIYMFIRCLWWVYFWGGEYNRKEFCVLKYNVWIYTLKEYCVWKITIIKSYIFLSELSQNIILWAHIWGGIFISEKCLRLRFRGLREELIGI